MITSTKEKIEKSIDRSIFKLRRKYKTNVLPIDLIEYEFNYQYISIKWGLKYKDFPLILALNYLKEKGVIVNTLMYYEMTKRKFKKEIDYNTTLIKLN